MFPIGFLNPMLIELAVANDWQWKASVRAIEDDSRPLRIGLIG